MTRPTCKEALELARAALEDDARMTPGPWHADKDWTWEVCAGSPGQASAIIAKCVRQEHAAGIAAARSREPALARWAQMVLDARYDAESDQWANESWAERVVDNEGADKARATAAALLRAADEAEAARAIPARECAIREGSKP